MEKSRKGRAIYSRVGVWREADGSIHMTFKDLKGGHIAVNAHPSRRNGHPTLFARLEQLLAANVPQEPTEMQVVFVSPDGTRTDGPRFKLDSGK